MSELKSIKLRILFISVGFVLFLGLVLVRSYQLHVVDNTRVNKLAQNQYQATLPVQPKRGTIYDRNGKILAIDIQVASIALHPYEISDKTKMAQLLSKELNLNVRSIYKKINSNKKFVWLIRRIPSEKGESLAVKKIKGISVVPEYRRYYPNKEIAGNLLGAVGYDAKALGGVELFLDSFVKSSKEKQVAQRDARGRVYTPINNDEHFHNIHLTVDLNLQFIAEKYLWQQAQKYNVKSGFAIISNPKNGEILAMANYPRFNPNLYWEYPQSQWRNHAAVDVFEPGSTFKPILAASAVSKGGIKPTDQFFCENGSYRIDKNVINDHDPYKNLTLSEIIKVSSNIGVTKVVQKIGKEKFYQSIQELGFGSKVGLPVPLEGSGRLVNFKRWRPIDQSNIAFGQGIAVTGIQMVQAYNTFANKGKKMKPYLVSKIVNSDNKIVVENKPTIVQEILNPSQADWLTHMLETVLEDGGTGKQARVNGYSVAGKTGTAQKYNPNTRSYDKHDYVSSFIGYVPSNKPEFVIYVVFDSPKPVHIGGVVAGPVFSQIAKEALSYKAVLPGNLKLAVN